jgi:hypothetical protein
VAGRRVAGDADSHDSHHSGMLMVGPTQDARSGCSTAGPPPPGQTTGAAGCSRMRSGFLRVDYTVIGSALIRLGAVSVSLRTGTRWPNGCPSSARRNQASPQQASRSPLARCRIAELERPR